MATPLILLALICVAALLWRDAMRARETATAVSRQVCRAYDVQFLDETVALRALGLKRGISGRLQLRRVYQFEYSTDGRDRCPGSITLTGVQVDAIYIAPQTGPARNELRAE